MLKKRNSATTLKQRHDTLCHLRAFSPAKKERLIAETELRLFENELGPLTRAERGKLSDSGIAGTRVSYSFSFDVARWLARKAPGAVSIDWRELKNSERLDDLLRNILLPAEEDYFDSGYVSTRDWLDIARAGSTGTDFDWLMAQLVGGDRSIWRQLYDAAELPLVWSLEQCQFSKSLNVFQARTLSSRKCKLRLRPANVKQAIQQPLASIRKQSKSRAIELIDVAIVLIGLIDDPGAVRADLVRVQHIVAIRQVAVESRHRPSVDRDAVELVQATGFVVGAVYDPRAVRT